MIFQVKDNPTGNTPVTEEVLNRILFNQLGFNSPTLWVA